MVSKCVYIYIYIYICMYINTEYIYMKNYEDIYVTYLCVCIDQYWIHIDKYWLMSYGARMCLNITQIVFCTVRVCLSDCLPACQAASQSFRLAVCKKVENRESRIENREWRDKNRELRSVEKWKSRIENWKSRIENRGSRIENWESRIENGPKGEMDGTPGGYRPTC